MATNDLEFALECFNEANKLGLPDSENINSKALSSPALPLKKSIYYLSSGALTQPARESGMEV
jgi:hypothetical protein